MAGGILMNAPKTMRTLVESYLAQRRQAGFELKIEGQQLLGFAAFADKLRHTGPLTSDLTMNWATTSLRNREPSRLTAARRIEVLRGFARFHKQFEPATYIPPTKLYGHGHRRKTPHIYTDAEIHALLDACTCLHPAGGLRSIA